jgi:hypothetical protein
VEIIEGPALVSKPERTTADGDRFACRYEAYLTDPRTERMKTRWQIELAIRLADD